MKDYFPKLNQTKNIGDAGVNLVASVINNDFKWIFRKNHDENDFGIDGYIDIVSDNGNVTGQSIALQIKAGKSFFRIKSKNGFTFYGEMKHLNYYRNHQIPVLIVICNLEKELCYFSVFDENRIEPTKTSWKINIKLNNKLITSSKRKIINLLPPLKEDITQIKEHWSQNSLFEKSSVIYYSVSFDEIKKLNTKPILDFIKRLTVNDNLYRKVQGKLEVTISGYTNDSRELFEISKVRKWVRKIEKKKIPWFFLSCTNEYARWLHIYYLSLINVKVLTHPRLNSKKIIEHYKSKGSLPQSKLEFDKMEFSEVLNLNFERLNKITDKLGLSNKLNEAISCRVICMIVPEISIEIKSKCKKYIK